MNKFAVITLLLGFMYLIYIVILSPIIKALKDKERMKKDPDEKASIILLLFFIFFLYLILACPIIKYVLSLFKN